MAWIASFTALAATRPVVARTDLVEFVTNLAKGEQGAWVTLAVVAGCVVFYILYEAATGEPFWKNDPESRGAEIPQTRPVAVQRRRRRLTDPHCSSDCGEP